MKIYTKTGDSGTTGLFGGARVDKDADRVEAYGTVDELNAVVGTARAAKPPPEVDATLERIQADLFVLGSELATVPGKEEKLPMQLLAAADSERLEGAIDALEATLPPLQNFVLPGGCPAAAALHHARTVCRRAERRVLRAHRGAAVRPEILVYLNRLSDYLFVAARSTNHVAGVADVPWAPRSG
ncbi:MAG TPA: cob(I)yrinic acid a,c-diamide adenosyltransferase [Polyangiaceae bacterium]|nr:cob(I)yrinic acid a,c-diamide adenosyltransferase [Polyangiaceae bacterium]